MFPEIIQCIENPHDADPGTNGIPVKTLDNLVRVRIINPNIISSPRKSSKKGNIPDGCFDFSETLPRIFIQVTHDRIRNCTAPDFHGIEFRIFIIREYTVHLFPGSSVWQRGIAVRHARSDP